MSSVLLLLVSQFLRHDIFRSPCVLNTKKTQERHGSNTTLHGTTASMVPTNDLFTHWIDKGDSEGFISQVEQLFFQYGLLHIKFHHLEVKDQLNLDCICSKPQSVTGK